MKQDLEVAVIFSRKYIPERDITVLVPQKVITGKCIQDSKFFIDNIDNKKIRNMDEVNYQNQDYGFYYATNIKSLEKKYETTDLELIFKKYMDDICANVHYYIKFDETNFDSYLLKNSSIDEFNKQYHVNFSYNYQNEESFNKIGDNNSKSSSKIDDKVANDIITVKQQLNQHISFQDEAIDKLLKTVYNNYIVGTKNNNILISGPTGVGKTATLKILSQCSNHPIIYCSIKKAFKNEEKDIYEIFDDILSDLYYDALDNQKTNSHSIVILDDFDKLNDEEIYEIQNELLHFFQQGKVTVQISQKIVFDANKITFIICGNFDKLNKVINVPEDFFSHENYLIDEENIVLDKSELINRAHFLEQLLPYFQTQVLFDSLNLDKAKTIIQQCNHELLRTYFSQLEKQGVRKIVLDDKTIDLLANYIYSKDTNLKKMDKIITDIFQNIMFDSLTYYGKESELYINEHILQKNEKGYQFTLKNRKDVL